MNLTYLPLLLKLANEAGPIIQALVNLEKAVTEGKPLDQEAKDILTAVEALIGDLLKGLA